MQRGRFANSGRNELNNSKNMFSRPTQSPPYRTTEKLPLTPPQRLKTRKMSNNLADAQTPKMSMKLWQSRNELNNSKNMFSSPTQSPPYTKSTIPHDREIATHTATKIADAQDEQYLGNEGAQDEH